MRFATLIVLALLAAPLRAEDSAVLADIDEAFRLAGVRATLDSLPIHVQEMTTAAIAQFPRDQRLQFEPVIKEVSLKFLDPGSFYNQLRKSFAKLYDAGHMNTFLALQRTSIYRTMHRMEQSLDTPAAEISRRRFEASLKDDPPDPKRVEILQRLDQARNATALQMRIVVGIVNAMANGLGAQMPPDLDAQCASFSTKIQPVLAGDVLHTYLYIYRNSEDADLEDYIAATQQKDVVWFNQNLQTAILAVAAERATKAGESIKAKVAQAQTQPPPPPPNRN